MSHRLDTHNLEMPKNMMINNDKELSNEEPQVTETDDQQPDDHPGIAVQGFLKIFDPESGEVFAQGRV